MYTWSICKSNLQVRQRKSQSNPSPDTCTRDTQTGHGREAPSQIVLCIVRCVQHRPLGSVELLLIIPSHPAHGSCLRNLYASRGGGGGGGAVLEGSSCGGQGVWDPKDCNPKKLTFQEISIFSHSKCSGEGAGEWAEVGGGGTHAQRSVLIQTWRGRGLGGWVGHWPARGPPLTDPMRVCLPGAPGIQIKFPAIYPNALPPNIPPSSSPEYLASAISGAHVWAEWPHHPCLLRGPQHGYQKWGKRGTTGKISGELCPAGPAR